ncbi:MAG: hypothetical protein ACD_48C00039G0002 [uncultured bacterium]|nr:MAG: hypothetical protein ACD_48C00039G0002 [uncultured bacterium]
MTVRIQVAIVHDTISIRVIFIFPTALRALVRGVENAAKIEARTNNEKENSAGSHLPYLGISFTSGSIKNRSPTDMGRMVIARPNSVFSIACPKISFEC